MDDWKPYRNVPVSPTKMGWRIKPFYAGHRWSVVGKRKNVCRLATNRECRVVEVVVPKRRRHRGS